MLFTAEFDDLIYTPIVNSMSYMCITDWRGKKQICLPFVYDRGCILDVIIDKW